MVGFWSRRMPKKALAKDFCNRSILHQVSLGKRMPSQECDNLDTTSAILMRDQGEQIAFIEYTVPLTDIIQLFKLIQDNYNLIQCVVEDRLLVMWLTIAIFSYPWEYKDSLYHMFKLLHVIEKF